MAGIGSGISAEITATSPTHAYPIPVTVTFKKGGSTHSVSNFANDFTTSFKPSALSGLEMWLDASDGSSVMHSSNSVSLWKDKSGNGNDATQSTSSKMPTYTLSNSLLNNKSSVSSSSASGSIGLNLPTTTLQEIFAIAYYKDGSDNTFDGYNTLISGPGTSGTYRVFGSTNTANWYTEIGRAHV